MKHPLWIVVPTYWGLNGTEEYPADTGAFDHPTPIEGNQTLERTIKSLCALPQDFTLLIILAVTHADLQEEAEQSVRKILKPYGMRKQICLVTIHDIDDLQASLLLPSLSLRSYGSIRNVQLIIPFLCGAEYVVAIDDDEIIEDRDYLAKIQTATDGNPGIDGLSGVYLNPDGSYLLPEPEELERIRNPFLKKSHLINLAVDEAMRSPDQPHPSHVAFGGNMVFSRRLIAKICHDEYIARGEDFDYVSNALCHGLHWYFLSTIPIVHLPPKHSSTSRADGMQKMLSDFSRFLYSAEKLNGYPPIDLSPYPGPFLHDRESLFRDCVDALTHEFPDLCTTEEAEQIVGDIREEARKRTGSYEVYRKIWEASLKSHAANSTIAFMNDWIESRQI